MTNPNDAIGPSPHDAPPVDPAWIAEFEAARRRPLALRWRYSFIKTYKPRNSATRSFAARTSCN